MSTHLSDKEIVLILFRSDVLYYDEKCYARAVYCYLNTLAYSLHHYKSTDGRFQDKVNLGNGLLET